MNEQEIRAEKGGTNNMPRTSPLIITVQSFRVYAQDQSRLCQALHRRYNRRGYFGGGRFKSVIVDKGETLINCLEYIDLNPLQAGVAFRPEEYRWNSLVYDLQTENKKRSLK